MAASDECVPVLDKAQIRTLCAASMEQKEAVAAKLVFAEFVFTMAVAMVIPTRAPMVLEIKK
eukprot:CAMPEP_0171116650 /NCGR_PEP_ID=MMETSP0766_2-20121228/90762_1 /TAXON_ID=439317 /ORGANISM="Gambierdiscus australes, Strain CAWD 149" /LENGTH=61 /DNA_ID=CAMNT_0011579101 /DNA_START=44 /DNA_END=226 /DNA_ORIENTATION=-